MGPDGAHLFGSQTASCDSLSDGDCNAVGLFFLFVLGAVVWGVGVLVTGVAAIGHLADARRTRRDQSALTSYEALDAWYAAHGRERAPEE